MKKQLLFLVVLCLAFTTKAQISDRVNDESTYLLGARPEAGNFGFFFGMSTVDIMDLSNDSLSISAIPIINVKYYYTDKLVIKAGIYAKKKRRSIDGEGDPNITANTDDGDFISTGRTAYKHVETDASWSFTLGAEKHFDLSNIIDGYIGANGNLGYVRSVRKDNIAYSNGSFEDNEGSSFGFTYGLETVIGTNFFIADLPMSLGIETGLSFKNYGANKYKTKYDENMGGTASSGTYYTSSIDDFEDDYANSAANNLQFTDLKARRFDILPLARITFTYYLKQ